MHPRTLVWSFFSMSQFIFLSAHYILHIFLRNKIFVTIRCSSECLLIHFLHVTEIIQHLNTISLTAINNFLLMNMFLILQNAAFVMMDSCSNLYKISSARCYECSKIVNQFICLKCSYLHGYYIVVFHSSCRWQQFLFAYKVILTLVVYCVQ